MVICCSKCGTCSHVSNDLNALVLEILKNGGGYRDGELLCAVCGSKLKIVNEENNEYIR